MSKSIQELKRELELAEQKERAKNKAKLLTEVKAYKNRCFITKTENQHGTFTAVIHYTKVRHAFFQRDEVIVNYTTVSVMDSKSVYIDHRLTMSNGELVISYVDELTRDHVQEISLKTFKELLGYFQDKKEAAIHLFNSKIGKVEDVSAVEEADPIIDIPHVHLTPPEANVLADSPFFISGHPNFKYLISENSLRIAKEKISEKEQFICGCGDDPVDRGYIQSSYNTISRLKQKLGLC